MLQELNFGPQTVAVPTGAVSVRVNKGPVRWGTNVDAPGYKAVGPFSVTAGANLTITGPGQIEWFQANGEALDAPNVGIVDNYNKNVQIPQTWTLDSDGNPVEREV